MSLRRPFTRKTMVELLRLALPMVVSQGTFAVMIFTDRYFMSQIDPVNMAAALGGGVASFFSFCFFVGLLSYGNALSAQYLGAGEPEKCPKVVTQGIVMTLMSAPFLTLITFLVAGIFETMGHEPAQVELERTYYLILMAGVLVTLAKVCLSSYFAGIGRTYVVMICDVFGLLVNVPLCYAMAFGKFGFPALGIVGAGISTVVATVLAFLLFVAFYLRREHREAFAVLDSFKVDLKILRRYWRLGFPSGLEMFLNVAAFNLFLLMFQSYGVAEGASLHPDDRSARGRHQPDRPLRRRTRHGTHQRSDSRRVHARSVLLRRARNRLLLAPLPARGRICSAEWRFHGDTGVGRVHDDRTVLLRDGGWGHPGLRRLPQPRRV